VNSSRVMLGLSSGCPRLNRQTYSLTVSWRLKKFVCSSGSRPTARSTCPLSRSSFRCTAALRTVLTVTRGAVRSIASISLGRKSISPMSVIAIVKRRVLVDGSNEVLESSAA
jgi:hypothetical protein